MKFRNFLKASAASVFSLALLAASPAAAYTVISANTWNAQQGVNADLAAGYGQLGQITGYIGSGSTIANDLSELQAEGITKIRTFVTNAGGTCANGAPNPGYESTNSAALTDFETLAAAGIKFDILVSNGPMNAAQVVCRLAYAATINAAYPGSVSSVEGVNESDNQVGTSVSISSGTYNSSTGLVTLSLASPQTFTQYYAAVTSGLTGTGSISSLNGVTWVLASGATGGGTTSTVTFNGPTGLGSITISGGTLTAGYLIAFQDTSNNITFGDTAALAMQKYIYAQTKANANLGSSVIVADYTTNTTWGGSLNPYPPSTGGVSFADVSNWHQYADTGSPNFYAENPYAVDAPVTGSSQPEWVTEYGYPLYPGNTARVFEANAANSLMEQLLDYQAANITSFRYGLNEDGNYFGDYYTGGSWTVHGQVLAALNTIVTATNSGALAATPSISATANLSALNHGNMIQVGNDLIIWAEPAGVYQSNGASNSLPTTPVSVTVALGATYNVAEYDPTAGATNSGGNYTAYSMSTGTAPTTTLTGVTSVTVSVAASPIILKLTYVSGGGGSTPTATAINATIGPRTPAASALVPLSSGIAAATSGGNLALPPGSALSVLTSASTLSSLTITYPAAPVDRQVECFTTQAAISSLSLVSAGSAAFDDTVTSAVAHATICQRFIASIGSSGTWVHEHPQ